MGLQMGKGKIAAQCGHATLGAFRIAQKYCKSGIKCWFNLGQAKIALKVPDDEKLLELEKQVHTLLLFVANRYLSFHSLLYMFVDMGG